MNKDLNGIVLAASVVSIATSIYLYSKGSRDTGIFVGLWAPTFLGLGSFASANRAAAVTAPEPAAA
jgi:hypothetical protein